MKFQDVAKYWSKVRVGADDECWEWQGRTTPGGYGYFGFEGVTRYAHRISYTISQGLSEFPPKDLIVMHLCDNRLCQNPNHLKGGTQLENMRDMAAKGRHRYGSSNPNSRLTEAQIEEIAQAYSKGDISMQALADQFHVSKRTVLRILSGGHWSHVERPDVSSAIADRKKGETKAHRGEAAGRKKLTEVAVREIVSLFRTGEYTPTELAAKFGVDRTSVSLILRGKTWTHLNLDLPDLSEVSNRFGDRHWTKRKKQSP